MKTTGIDHVNILTDDLDASARFYEHLLGLKRGPVPIEGADERLGAWLFDPSGAPLVHLRWNDPDGDLAAESQPGGPTGAFRHVSFRCEGFDETIARLEEMGLDYQSIAVEALGQRLVFTRDPSNITVEMNFAGD